MDIVLFVVLAVVALVAMGVAWRAERRAARGTEGPSEDQVVQMAQMEERCTQLSGQLQQVRDERDMARSELEQTQTQLASVQADHTARQEELEKARLQNETLFKGVAAEVAKSSNEEFLKQAKEQFEGQRELNTKDLDERKQAIDNLVKPVRESLDKFDKRVGEIEEKREGAYESLREQVGQLRNVTGNLSEAMRSSQMRGQWGELQLRNVLELSGLSEHISFNEQVSTASEESRSRPDAVVHVPGGVEVVIDAKTPLNSYLDAHNTEDEQHQRTLLDRHAGSLLGHAKTLGDRDYAAVVQGSPDFTVMFVPADPILDAALEVQPALWEDAWRKHRVLIATPGLLLAFLRTVAMAWQQQALQENAQQIAEEAKVLYERLRVYTEHVGGVGKGLQRAVDAYNKSVGSLESRVLTQAKRLEELGPAANVKHIESPGSVEASIRASRTETEPE